MTLEYNDKAYTLDEFREYVKENIMDFEFDLIRYLEDYTTEMLEEYIYGRRYFGSIDDCIDQMTEDDFLNFDGVWDLED